MKKKILWFAGLVVAACAIPLVVSAVEQAKPEAGPAMTAKEQADLKQQVELFSDIVTAGEAQKDPLLLVTAVKILDQIPAGVQKGEGKDAGVYERDALLTEAKEYAAGDAELLAVIGKVEAAPEATAVRGHRHHGDGPGYYYDRHYHHHEYRCHWYRECYHGRCDWVCGRGPSRWR
jgi:hypothetical protein